MDKKFGAIILSMILYLKNELRMCKESFINLCLELMPFVLKNLLYPLPCKPEVYPYQNLYGTAGTSHQLRAEGTVLVPRAIRGIFLLT